VKYNVSSCPGSYSSGGLVAPSASSQTYDANGNEVSSTSYGETVAVTDYSYDALNRQTNQTDPDTQLAITNATWSSGSGGQATVDFASTYPLPIGSTVIISGISPSGYNGAYSVVSSTITSVTYAKASNPGTYSSGGTLVSGAGYLGVTNATWSSESTGPCAGVGGQATLSFATTSIYPQGKDSIIVVSGISPSGYNTGGHFTSASSNNSVSFCLASSPGSYVSGGAIGTESQTAYDANGNQSTPLTLPATRPSPPTCRTSSPRSPTARTVRLTRQPSPILTTPAAIP